MKNKAILMSIKPKYVAKILNGDKTIEVRKKFPKYYVGWVYVYCTKDTKNCLFNKNFNGKVVARFWCDKVYDIEVEENDSNGNYSDTYIYCDIQDLEEQSCLDFDDIIEYLWNYDKWGGKGYAIHISKLEVFDKPKELREFRHTCKAEYRGYNCWQPCSKECKNCVCNQLDDEGYSQCFSRLKKAPQSWCYVED